ncbi:MAG: 16S rRNA (cytidine(1402)-2'-O)-methyltransferase [Rickettsiales bacterium]|jgi:16S rRNA (cytidine1402-2'-O)-methyltransferase|nr:16S rRNA (cytidine(1402)-2'-O)-methyltransferase [Rickettsiales bacterium]
MKNGLYIVGTPIGNLGDFSPRAVEILKSADLIACEDTRVSKKLASYFKIKTSMIVFAEHNEIEVLPGLVGRIQSGEIVAAITDSGMPGISDPGFRLVRACRERELPVFVVPGPTAAISALVLSGFPTDKFTFCGFLKGEKDLIENNRIRHTIIFYESPNRIMSTIASCAKIMPERKIAIVREITKVHEETIIGYPADLINIEPPMGEIVLLIAPAPDKKITDDEISNIVKDVIETSTSAKNAAAEIANRAGISKRNAYEMVVKNGK